MAGLFGFTAFPVYSVSAAHANDFATSEERVELAAALLGTTLAVLGALMLALGLGAIAYQVALLVFRSTPALTRSRKPSASVKSNSP